MTKVNWTCGTCGGTGFIIQKTPVSELKNTVRLEKEECPECKGTGHVRYAMFTLEEAEQIMKVCGLADEVKKHE